MSYSGEKFVSDISFPDMLWVKIVRSSVSSGTIREIKIPRLSRGYRVFGGNDIPGKNVFLESELSDDILPEEKIFKGPDVPEDRLQREMLRRPWLAVEGVNYIGEPVLLVAGSNRGKVESIASSIVITYEENRSLTDPIEALQEGRVLKKWVFGRGSYEKVYESAYQVVEEEYEIPPQEHLYDEPLCAVANWDGRRLTVYSQVQDPFLLRRYLASFLNIGERKIRVIVPSTGGALNGKIEDAIQIAGYVALVSFKTGFPAKIMFARDEDLTFASKSYPVIARYRSVVDSDGNLTGLNVKLIIDSGAYETEAYDSLFRMQLASLGVYRCNDVHLEVYLVRTNKVPLGMFEGLGAPQGFLGIEVLSSRLAEISMVDPYIWKKQNLVSKGSVLPSGYILRDYDIPLRVLDKVVENSDFQRKYAAYEMAKKRRVSVEEDRFPLRGIGLSLVFQPAGLPDYYEAERKSSIVVKFDRNRNVVVFDSFFDYMGLDRNIVFDLIEKYGFDVSRVIFESVDTDVVPDTGPSLSIRRGVIVEPVLERALTLLRRKRLNSILPISVKASYRGTLSKNRLKGGLPYRDIVWIATVVEVEIDPVDLGIGLRGVWFVTNSRDKHSDDKVEKRKIFLSEIEAGIEHGLGFVFGKKEFFAGKQTGRRNFFVVRANNISFPVSIDFVTGGEGVGCIKCTGELGVVGVAPAFIGAVSQATGVYINRMPVSSVMLYNYVERLGHKDDAGVVRDEG